MVATLQVFIATGGSDGSPGAEVAVPAPAPSSIRFKTNDNATIDSVDPIPIPASGTKYSYWKSLFLKCTVAPSTSVNNFKIYTDGVGFGAGITVNIGNDFPTHTSASTAGYEVATGTAGDTGDELVANHAGITSKSDLFTFTSASPKVLADVDFISETGNLINAVNETTNYLLMQADITSAAGPGTKTAETITIVYDEV